MGIRYSLNIGLSDLKKKGFPDIIPIKRPLVKNKPIEDSNWLIGFILFLCVFIIRYMMNKNQTSKYKKNNLGEGCFMS